MKAARFHVYARTIARTQSVWAATRAGLTEGGVFAEDSTGAAIERVGVWIEAAKPAVDHVVGACARAPDTFKSTRTNIRTTAAMSRVRVEIKASLTALSPTFFAGALTVDAIRRRFADFIYAPFIGSAFFVAAQNGTSAHPIDTLFCPRTVLPASTAVRRRRLEVHTDSTASRLRLRATEALAVFASLALHALPSTLTTVLLISSQIDAISPSRTRAEHIRTLGVFGLAAP